MKVILAFLAFNLAKADWTELTSDNFESVVYDDSKDVVLFIYSSAYWCTLCVKEKPLMDEVKLNHEADADTVWAQVDTEQVDVRELFGIKVSNVTKYWKKRLKLFLNIVKYLEILFQKVQEFSKCTKYVQLKNTPKYVKMSLIFQSILIQYL